MPYASNSPRPTHADFAPASSLVVERATETRDAASVATPVPETASTAHRAVEAVLTAAQRFSTGERHAVSLQFSVGGTDLNVRVEMRADEVRATFRTDSAELRDALSHEWNAAQTDAGARPFRLAAPVFTSNDTSGFSQFSGDQAAQQQQQRQSATRQANDLFAIGATRGRGARDTSAVGSVASAPVRAALSTALHLHTLA